jgi:hypothetical protein
VRARQRHVTCAASSDMPGSSSNGGRPSGSNGGGGRGRKSGKARKPGLFEIKVVSFDEIHNSVSCSFANSAAKAMSVADRCLSGAGQLTLCCHVLVFQVTPPPRSLGIYALPPNTHNGEEVSGTRWLARLAAAAAASLHCVCCLLDSMAAAGCDALSADISSAPCSRAVIRIHGRCEAL